MAQRGRPPSSKTLVDRQLGRNIMHPSLPEDGYNIPNHSGDHSAGTTGTPVADRDIANKKYVDDNSGTEVNNLGVVVTWANVPDANITEGSVTQHEAAIDHDALLNYLATEHVIYSAGEGLDLSGGVFSGEDASPTNKGIATFSLKYFNTASGDVEGRMYGSMGATATYTTLSAATIGYGVYHGGQTHSSTIGILMARNGSIIGIGGLHNVTAIVGAGGSFIAESRVNNTAALTASVGVSAIGVFKANATAAFGTHTFSAGDLIQLSVLHGAAGVTFTGDTGIHLTVQYDAENE